MTSAQAICITRKTNETTIELSLQIDGSATFDIRTGLPFFDHMLEQLTFHAGWDLRLRADGDIGVDDHHLIEDVAIALGDALNQARQARNASAINRYGQRLLPMDGSLVLCAIDLDGRGNAVIQLPFSREQMGGIATEMWPHFFKTLSARGQFSLHIQTQYFDNNHHLLEASFKALARALREACTFNNTHSPTVPSTKGCL